MRSERRGRALWVDAEVLALGEVREGLRLRAKGRIIDEALRGPLDGLSNVHAQHAATAAQSVSRSDRRDTTLARLAELARTNRDQQELLERERRLRGELESAGAAKDRFIAVLSHDLRAPLNAVLGWTQLLRREPLDQSSRARALAVIEQNAKAQVRLLDELLDAARFADNRAQLEGTTLDLSALVRRSLDAGGEACRHEATPQLSDLRENARSRGSPSHAIARQTSVDGSPSAAAPCGGVRASLA